MIKEKVIDTHLHVEAWENSESNFIDCFEQYKEESGLYAVNLCSVRTKQRAVCNNMMLALYKIAHTDTYAHGALDHIIWPITEDMPEGMDLVTQYKELMEIGFDGIKMLEGKPSHLKRNGNNLNTAPLERVFAEIERDGTHLILHSNDPKEFWLEETREMFDERGWWYGRSEYLTHEQIYEQTEKMLAAHPSIKVTLAHFYFCGETPSKLIDLFEKYPNLCVDITQGSEMYDSFQKNHEYYKNFFNKYSKRILLGTDSTFPWGTNVYNWLIDRTYRFIATADTTMAFNDKELTGINLQGEAREDILYRNFENRVGTAPRKINKQALKKYVEKYKPLLSEEEWKSIKPLCEKYI